MNRPAAESEPPDRIRVLLDSLQKLSSSKGYLTQDELFQELDRNNLPAADYSAVLVGLHERGIELDETSDNDPGYSDIDGLEGFFRQSRHQVLTAAEERTLGERIEAGILAERALEDSPPAPAVTSLRQQAADGRVAREEFALANIRLVVSIAVRFQRRGLDLDDLVQEGFIGLMRAVEKFDPYLGTKFSTYATWWIRQALQRALADKSRTIRIPVHMVELISRIRRDISRLERTLGRSPTRTDLLERIGCSGQELDLALRAGYIIRSLDAAIDGTGSALGELLPDRNPSLEDEVISRLLGDFIRELVAELTDRERDVIERRYGLRDGKPRTLEDIGRELGVTRERIRQIETRTLAKLRHPRRVRVLEDYIAPDAF